MILDRKSHLSLSFSVPFKIIQLEHYWNTYNQVMNHFSLRYFFVMTVSLIQFLCRVFTGNVIWKFGWLSYKVMLSEQTTEIFPKIVTNIITFIYFFISCNLNLNHPQVYFPKSKSFHLPLFCKLTIFGLISFKFCSYCHIYTMQFIWYISF